MGSTTIEHAQAYRRLGNTSIYWHTDLFVGEIAMSLLKWALVFFIVSLIAALFGFTDIAAASAEVARILFYIFLVIFVVLLILGLVLSRRF